MARRAVIAVLAGSLVGVAAYATIAPYDFTGAWAGTAQTPGKPVATLSADLTMTPPPAFTGTLTVVTSEETFHCTANGHQRRRVVITAPCDNTGRLTLRGTLDAGSGTLSGKLLWKPPPSEHKPAKHGMFTLIKQG